MHKRRPRSHGMDDAMNVELLSELTLFALALIAVAVLVRD